MNFNILIYRLKKLKSQITSQPLIIFKIFNLKKLFRGLKQLFNVQVSFKDLNKDYQLKVMFNRPL